MELDPSIFVHPTAVVDDGAKIGNGTKVWHWTHICSGAKIGKNCSFGQNVFVGNTVNLGNNVKVQNNVSIYDNVNLEDDVFCGPSMVFTNVINPRSKIIRKNEYKKTLVKKGVTLGANCTIICGLTIANDAFIAAGAVVTKDVKPFALMAGVPAIQIGWISSNGDRIELPLTGNGLWRCKTSGDCYKLVNGNLSIDYL